MGHFTSKHFTFRSRKKGRYGKHDKEESRDKDKDAVKDPEKKENNKAKDTLSKVTYCRSTDTIFLFRITEFIFCRILYFRILNKPG